jgi:hypothetical protein
MSKQGRRPQEQEISDVKCVCVLILFTYNVKNIIIIIIIISKTCVFFLYVVASYISEI